MKVKDVGVRKTAVPVLLKTMSLKGDYKWKKKKMRKKKRGKEKENKKDKRMKGKRNKRRRVNRVRVKWYRVTNTCTVLCRLYTL